MSPKQFRQVLANFGFTMNDEELQSLIKTYGNDRNDIKYLDFINDANPFKGMTLESNNGTKSTYQARDNDFSGETELERLLRKIKT